MGRTKRLWGTLGFVFVLSCGRLLERGAVMLAVYAAALLRRPAKLQAAADPSLEPS